MTITIKFICRTCEYRNTMETGTDGYKQRQTEFDSLTEAYVHLNETHNNLLGHVHDMEIKGEIDW